MSHLLYNLWQLLSMTASHLFSGGWHWFYSTVLTITPLNLLLSLALAILLGIGTCWAFWGGRSLLHLSLTQTMHRNWEYRQQVQADRLHTEALLAEVQAIYDTLEHRAEAIEQDAKRQAAREGLEEMRKRMFGA